MLQGFRSGLPGALLLGICLLPLGASGQRAIDGTGNHPADLGAAGDLLIRLAPADYGDAIATPAGAGRPSPRAISNGVVAQAGAMPSSQGVSDLFWLWGQFVDHDLDLTPGASPAEPFGIPVPTGDPWFDPLSTGTAVIPLHRSLYDPSTGTGVGNPREQVNVITSFLDASMVYGSDAARAAFLRASDGTGRLKTSAGNLLPFNTGGFANANDVGLPASSLFLAGDVRANENVALTAMHTLFVREHNRLADAILGANPGFDDDQVYEAARLRVGAQIQAITYNEFLPMLLGPAGLGAYGGYAPGVDPRISSEFSTAAYRFGHSLLGPVLQRRDGSGAPAPEGDLSLADAFFNPGEITAYGIESLLMGAAHNNAQELDTRIVDAVRNFLFGPPGSGGLDLASLNIQRGRDHGLSSYNATRAALGLPVALGFADVTSDPVTLAALATSYADVDEIDLWVGGLAEDALPGALLGETFATIVADQFARTRDGDAFWYEAIFAGAELAEISATRLSDVILRNTGIAGMHGNVLFTPEPSTALLLAAGLAALARARRRPRR